MGSIKALTVKLEKYVAKRSKIVQSSNGRWAGIFDHIY